MSTQQSQTEIKQRPALFVEVENELHQQIKAEATRLGMSVSSFVRLLVMQYFDSVRFERHQ